MTNFSVSVIDVVGDDTSNVKVTSGQKVFGIPPEKPGKVPRSVRTENVVDPGLQKVIEVVADVHSDARGKYVTFYGLDHF